VRHDERLRKTESGLRLACTGEQVFHLGGEGARLAGVEKAGHGGATDAGH
jgi:hypothetical protein